MAGCQAFERKIGMVLACAHCQAEFPAKNVRARFCSDECRAAAWQTQPRRELSLALEELGRVTKRLPRLRTRSWPADANEVPVWPMRGRGRG